MKKRAFLSMLGSLGALAAGIPARAQSPEFSAAWQRLAATRKVNPGRVTLEIPRLADNGYSVPLKVRVDSPMTPADHVTQVTLLSDRNPRAVIAAFTFGPRSGHATVSTRVRLNGSQRVFAVARMSDGSLWSAEAPVEVTESACLDAT